MIEIVDDKVKLPLYFFFSGENPGTKSIMSTEHSVSSELSAFTVCLMEWRGGAQNMVCAVASGH